MSLLDSLVSYWKLDESSGDAIDSVGSNTLTDNNTVGSAVGKIGNARDFEADNSEFFKIADNASLSTGDIDFTLAGWVRLESKTDFRCMIRKQAAVGECEYGIIYSTIGDRFEFDYSSDGVAFLSEPADNLGSPSVATWYYIVAWHDAVANTVNIQVNNGTVDSASFSSGVRDGTGSFAIGTAGDITTALWDGLIDEVGFWKRVLTAQERTDLYNNGNGFAYPFTAATTTRVGRVPRNTMSPVGRTQRRMGSPISRAR